MTEPTEAAERVHGAGAFGHCSQSLFGCGTPDLTGVGVPFPTAGHRAQLEVGALMAHHVAEQVAGGVDDQGAGGWFCPPTTGQLYLLAYGDKNAALGEDVRTVWREDAQRVHLPDEDFWIFDAHLVAILVFDDDDDLTGAELITEPAAVNQYIYDDREVVTESWHAELWLDDSDTLALCLRTWKTLRESAVYGTGAHSLIDAARRDLNPS